MDLHITRLCSKDLIKVIRNKEPAALIDYTNQILMKPSH